MPLKRSLSLRNATLLIVGNVVGAGIFTTSGFLAGDVQNPAVFIGVWIVGGFLTLCGALTYAELGALYPRAGGDYQFLKEAYSPMIGFILGWLSFWVITPGSIAALSLAFANYIPGIEEGSLLQKMAAVATVLMISVLNIRGAKLAGNTQDIVTTASILLLVGIVVFGFAMGTGSADNFTVAGDFSLSKFRGSALISVIFTYSGWFAAAYIGSEIKNPKQNIPRALIVGTIVVMVLYTFVNAVYLYAVPLSEMKNTTEVAKTVVTRLFGSHVGAILVIAIASAILSCINASVMTGSRICYAMSKDAVFFKSFSLVHPKYGTPHVAVIAQAAIALALVFAGTFEVLEKYVVIAMLLASMAGGGAVFILRKTQKDRPRPYRTFGYPVIPILFILAYGYILVAIVKESVWVGGIGLGLIVSGIPFYFLFRYLSQSPKSK